MTVGKIVNGLVRGFVKHRLSHLLITDPLSLLQPVPNLYTLLLSEVLKTRRRI